MVDTTSPRLNHVGCLRPDGLYRMAYWTWGDPGAGHVVVCAHGLSRQGRDFDELARSLCAQRDWRVVCPDVLGRGQSQWLRDPGGYQVPAYVSDMVTLLARLQATALDWVGTSMGGLIGMGLAALRDTPVRRLVLNDVGPAIQFAALERIGGYLGRAPVFATREEGEDYLRDISTGFGPHSPAQWQALSQPMLVPDGERLRLHYDPAIAVPFRALTQAAAAAGEAALWAAFDAIRCETLLVRGAESDLLSEQTAQAMTQRGPRPRLHTVEGVGHAPTLVHPEQIAVVRDFLLG